MNGVDNKVCLSIMKHMRKWYGRKWAAALVCFLEKISRKTTGRGTVSCSVTYKLLLLICGEPCHLLFVSLHLLLVVLEVSHCEPRNEMQWAEISFLRS